ncbi:hypothetical protein [Mesorhizobium sp. CN2-181]|uniref:hypothetical protein n=1 Tax=Mesorhizobium yinganensis TaxID=3157707 RepID=UPI0032B79904
MREALADRNLFGTILNGDSWQVWRILLIALMGEPLTADERTIFTALTKREREPLHQVEEFWGIVGRRGGKTRAMSVLSAYLAALCDWSDVLVRGERGKLPYIASTQKQASNAFEYAKAIFDLPVFRLRLAGEPTADCISLDNRIDIEIRAGNWRSIRGVTSIAALFDELAFFQSSEESANTDKDILTAIRPSLATTGGPLIAITSPFAKAGEVYQAAQQYFKPDADPLILVARGASRDFNPSLPQKVVDRAMQRDPAAASAEYLGLFRDDISNFVDPEIVAASIMCGIGLVLPNKHRTPYTAFVDPSGGSNDSFTLAIAHDGLNDRNCGDDLIRLDRIEEARPPFRPGEVVAKFVKVLREYGISVVHGDSYGAEWVRDAFARHGITYVRSPLTRSDLYLNFLPILNSRAVQLLDNPRMVSQFSGLQRRVTNNREVVDHPSNSHDDVANAAAGAVCLVARRRAGPRTTVSTVRT